MNNSNSTVTIFDENNIWKILFRIAPPVMLAQLIHAMYNIVDSYFVGRYSGDGLTALSVIFPVQLIVTALAVGTGVGVNTLMSRDYARGRVQRANRTAGTGAALAVISWVIFAVLSSLFMRPYVATSAESPQAVEYAVTYGRIVCVDFRCTDQPFAGSHPHLRTWSHSCPGSGWSRLCHCGRPGGSRTDYLFRSAQTAKAARLEPVCPADL